MVDNAGAPPLERMKPGQPITSLTSSQAGLALTHPAQIGTVARLIELIEGLRSCEKASDLFEFQKKLFGHVYAVEQRRAECSRLIKRLRAGSGLPSDLPAPPHNGSPSDIDSWLLEAVVYERLARQYRSIGDALAWRCVGYDRRVILALAQNASPGPMYGKEGLPYELGRVDQLWKDKGHFALLHDLTNCLRIGDITEFTSDGDALLHEVKAKATPGGAQVRRIEKAIDSVMIGGAISNEHPNSRFVRLKTSYSTQLNALNDIIQLAKEHGCRGMKLPPGRAVIASSILRMDKIWLPEESKAAIESIKQRAIKRAGIQGVHQIRGVSGDMASRSPVMPPWTIFPFSAEDCAALVCDLIIFETVLAPNGLVDELKRAGLNAEVKMGWNGGVLPQDIVSVQWKDRGLMLHDRGLGQLLYELVDVRTWAQGIREVLQGEPQPGQPVLIFANEAVAWHH